MPLIIRLGIICLFALAAPASAAAYDGLFCRALLAVKKLISGGRVAEPELKRIRHDFSFLVSVDPTIRVAGLENTNDPRGHRLIIERLEEMDWNSSYASESFANQGDPRRFVQVAGFEVARFFGYELRDDSTLVVPSAKRFNWALEELNQALKKEKVTLGFFSAREISETSDALARFSQNAELPLATEFGDTVDSQNAVAHDHSFHTPAIFIPDEAIQLARRQAKAVVDFHSFVEKEAPELAAIPEVSEYFKGQLYRVAMMIDFGTGNFSAYLTRFQIFRFKTFGGEVYDYGFKMLTAFGLSPKKLVDAIAADNFPILMSETVEPYLNAPGLKTASHIEALKKLAQRFNDAHAESPGFEEGLALKEKQFLDKVRKRILLIQKTVKRLEKKARKPAQENFADAAIDAPLCNGLLDLREIIRRKRIDRKVLAELRNTHNELESWVPTVKVEKKIDEEDPRGERYVIRHEPGERWGSKFGSEKFANQGDPRRFIMIAGHDVARFFGYEMLGEEAVIVPSAKRLNWAIKKLNEWGRKERIDLKFYESSGVENTTQFLKHFMNTGELPLSTAQKNNLEQHGAHSHDHAFHTPALFLPNEIILLARRQLSAVIDFMLFIKETEPQFYNDLYTTLFFNHTLKRLAIALDFGTGNFAAHYELALVHGSRKTDAEAGNLQSTYDFGFKLLANGGLSPQALLESIVDARPPNEVYTSVKEYANPPKHKTPGHQQTMKRLLQSFVEKNAETQGFNDTLTFDQKDFFKALSRRMLRFEAAIRKHQLEDPSP